MLDTNLTNVYIRIVQLAEQTNIPLETLEKIHIQEAVRLRERNPYPKLEGLKRRLDQDALVAYLRTRRIAYQISSIYHSLS